MNRLNIFEFRQNGLRRKASYDTFYVKIFFSFFVIFNRQWSHGKGFSCQCVVNLRNSIKFWWDFLQCGGHGVVGWFNALSAFRPTFNLMASAGRSCTGNNDFFFWFQLQKCPCCVIYWCPLSKAEALWCLDWSFFSFIISCALCQKIENRSSRHFVELWLEDRQLMRCFPVICADYETALSLFSIVYLFSRTQ